jgi:hypothetical protein
MDRRTLVNALPAAALLGCLGVPALAQRRREGQPAAKAFDVQPADALVAQSGVLGAEVFVVGVLRCSDPPAAGRRIQAARQQTKYRCVLSHRSRNKFKAAYFEALLDDWQHHDDVHLQLLVVHPPASPAKAPSGDAWMRAYVDQLTKALAMTRATTPGKIRLLTPQRFQAPQQAEMERLLLARNRHVVSIEKVWPRSCELMQFLNTVTGVVKASHDKLAHVDDRNPAKTRTIQMLRASLRADLSRPMRNKRLDLQVA